MRRICAVLAVIYLIGGIGVWIEFMRTNPDGLANVGLILYVFPITVLGLILGRLTGRTEFILIPDRFGYWGDHAMFFFPSLLLVAAMLAWGPPKILRMWRSRRSGTPVS